MILVFDVGNTNMVIGVFEKDELLYHWRVRTDVLRTSDEYGMLVNSLFDYNGLDMKEVNDIVISSVVPTLMVELHWMSERILATNLWWWGRGSNRTAIKYDNPREVGADRVVNAVAAYAQ